MKKFNALLEEIETRNLMKEAYQIASQRYYLKPYQISNITPNDARNLYQSILDKFYKGVLHENSRNWFENQLRLFIWTLICYLFLNRSGLEEMTQKDWQLFTQIFPKKDPELFEYQSQALKREKIKIKERNWESKESEILTQIMMQKNDKTQNGQKVKWNQISKQLYFMSQKKFFRTAKQCRQRWLNHLDPSKKKGKWSAEQCFIMFDHVKNSGKKWAELVEKLGKTRNQHSIKNKFNSLFRKQQKMNSKYSENEIYDVILQRIHNTIRNRSHEKASQIVFDIEDIPSSNNPVVQKPKKRQTESQLQTPVSNFHFPDFVRKLKTFNSQPKPNSTNRIFSEGDQSQKDTKTTIKEEKQSEKIEEEKNQNVFEKQFSNSFQSESEVLEDEVE